MKQDELDAIRARCEAATPGPWNYGEAVEWRRGAGPFEDRGAEIISFSDVEVVVGGLQDEQGGAVGVLRNADAAFIAHARADVPALLNEVARLNAIIAHARIIVDEVQLIDNTPMEARDVRLELRYALDKKDGDA